MNYYERWIGDYVRDTTMLSMMDEGAYSRLIDYCYSTEKPLPLDEKEIFAIGRAGSRFEKKSILRVLSLFFRRTSDGYIQKRIVEEIERYKVKQDKARKAADARWKGARNDADASVETCERNARASIVHGPSNAPQSSVSKPKTLKPKPRESVDLIGPTRAHAYTREAADDETRSTHARPGELSLVMRKAGIDAQAFNPDVIAAANAGVTVEQLAHACERAKQRPGVASLHAYALKIAVNAIAEAADSGTPSQVNGATPPPTISAKEARLLRDDALIDGLTGRSRRAAQRAHDPQNDTLTEVRYVGEKKSS